MKFKQIVFTEKYKAELLESERELAPGQVCVKTVLTTISPGTERANLMGDPNLSIRAPMQEATYPRTVGYSASGIVTAVGEGVTHVVPGDRVVVFLGSHSEYNILPAHKIVKIPYEQNSFEEAAVSFIATFPLAAVRKTRLEVGESMLVMGQGLLGQLAVMMAKAAGAVPVIAADPVESRREEALKNGADYALDPTDPDFSKKVKELTEGGANCAVEVTGVGQALDTCLDCMAKMGRVALLGCTRDKNFTIDYYRKVHGPGITLIGAHTAARPDHESYPAHFTHKDDILTVLKLCAAGRIDIKRMCGTYYSPADCQKAFDGLMYDKNFPIVVQFDWRML